MLLPDLIPSKNDVLVLVRKPMNSSHCQISSVRCLYSGIFEMLMSDLVPIKIWQSSDGLMADAICLTVNSRRSDVCNEAILECYGPILFLLKYDGSVMVRRPMQFVSLSIYVGQMFAMKQFMNVIVRSYSF